MLRKSPVSYLVVNGDESEPATFKDHYLVERHDAGKDVAVQIYHREPARAETVRPVPGSEIMGCPDTRLSICSKSMLAN